MLHTIVRPFFSGLLDLIYPRTCLLCHSLLSPSESMEYLCPKCLSSFPYNHPVFCAKCSRPLGQKPQKFCKHCSRKNFYFDQCWSALIYDDTIRHLIHLFKYGKNTGLRLHFATFLSDFVEKYNIPIHDCDLIIPVPIHPTRFRERGFNQSELIALLLSHHFQIPCNTSLLKRIRYTPNQARVNSKQRWTNMQGTFRIRNPNNNINRNILVIDDVLTTGATLSEVARELKYHGAQKIYGLTVAIAI